MVDWKIDLCTPEGSRIQLSQILLGIGDALSIFDQISVVYFVVYCRCWFPSICTEQQSSTQLSANHVRVDRMRRSDWPPAAEDDTQPALAFSDFAGNRVYQHSDQEDECASDQLYSQQ